MFSQTVAFARSVFKETHRKKAAATVAAWLAVAALNGHLLNRGAADSLLYLSSAVTGGAGALLVAYLFQLMRAEERARQAQLEEIERKARTFSQISEIMQRMLLRLETDWCNNPKALSTSAQSSLHSIRSVAHLIESRNERIKMLLQIQTQDNTQRAEGLLLLPIETEDRYLSMEINYSIQAAETVAKELRRLFEPLHEELSSSDADYLSRLYWPERGNDFWDSRLRSAFL